MKAPHPREDQFAHMGSLVSAAGDQMAAHGASLWDMTRAWLPGAKAANLDPDSGGWRYEQDVDGTVWPVPSDSTGEAAVAPPDAAAHLHAEQRDIVQRMTRDAARYMELCRMALRAAPPSVDDPTAWCANHLRIGVCEPRHRGDLCRWCDDFRREHRNQLPPASLLGARHRGLRITERMVEAAMRETRRKAG